MVLSCAAPAGPSRSDRGSQHRSRRLADDDPRTHRGFVAVRLDDDAHRASPCADAALLSGVYADGASRPNLGRYMFLDPRSRDFYIEWAAVAKDVVSALRIEAGRNPYDRGLTDLVRALPARVAAPPPRREVLRPGWASHNVRLHRTSTKQMHHPVVGDLELTGEA